MTVLKVMMPTLHLANDLDSADSINTIPTVTDGQTFDHGTFKTPTLYLQEELSQVATLSFEGEPPVLSPRVALGEAAESRNPPEIRQNHGLMIQPS